ncbi:hypothetical protein LSH36_12g07036 [Paralvinella palmiformis]|uniref:Uncharacterized protein n=1 Tax=Paralvinella palmiformis TaxID=53620 RepID=A0AAD9KD75_9ANNE|nr:hypothetical protein LSH36_12g07036 [Paralvinella palmiformis]
MSGLDLPGADGDLPDERTEWRVCYRGSRRLPTLPNHLQVTICPKDDVNHIGYLRRSGADPGIATSRTPTARKEKTRNLIRIHLCSKVISSISIHYNETGRAKNTTKLLDLLLDGYDNRLRPNFGGPPTLIDVNMNIRSVGPISDLDMAYQLDCYFRQSWVDTRLRFTSSMDKLAVSVNILDRLWKPDTHFFNGKKSYLHMMTTPNKLLRIYKDGRILYSMRITIKATCPMHLETFPMDTQTCPLKFGSHGYSENDLLYIWTKGANNSIKIAADTTLSQFDIVGIPAGNMTKYDRGLGGRRYSALFANFVLQRHTGYFLINVYVPCSLLVAISWVGFWINREATADRIALGVTTVLTMTFVGIENRRDLPKVSYSTALDYFVAVCFAFVLATILQFAGVHFFTKHGSGEVYIIPESSSSSSSSSSEEDDDDDDGGGVDAQDDNDTVDDQLKQTSTKSGKLSCHCHHQRHEHQFDRGRHMSVRACAARTQRNSFKTNGMSAGRTPRGVIRQHDVRDDHHRHRDSCLYKLWQCVLGNNKYRDSHHDDCPGTAALSYLVQRHNEAAVYS